MLCLALMLAGGWIPRLDSFDTNTCTRTATRTLTNLLAIPSWSSLFIVVIVVGFGRESAPYPHLALVSSSIPPLPPI